MINLRQLTTLDKPLQPLSSLETFSARPLKQSVLTTNQNGMSQLNKYIAPASLGSGFSSLQVKANFTEYITQPQFTPLWGANR